MHACENRQAVQQVVTVWAAAGDVEEQVYFGGGGFTQKARALPWTRWGLRPQTPVNQVRDCQNGAGLLLALRALQSCFDPGRVLRLRAQY